MKTNTEFEQFYRQYFNYVMFIVAQQIPRKEDREDIVSEIFIDVWKLFENLDENGNIKSLIFTLAKRRTYDFLRKHYRLHEYELPILHEIEYIETEELKTELPQLNTVQKLVYLLDKKYQMLYQLKYVEHLSSLKIAKELGITTNYVKVLNNRLIKQLQKLWNSQT